MRIRIFIAVLALLCLPVIAAAGCPAPAIYVTPTVLNAETLTPDQAAEYNAIFSRELWEANPGVVVTSAQDIGTMLASEQQAIDSGEKAASSGPIAQKTRAGYVTSLTIGQVGSRYTVTSSLTDADLAIVVCRASSEVGSIDAIPGALSAQVKGMGDLVSLIRAHETAHPVPPRAPALSVTVDPKSVTSEDIRDSTTMTVKVTSCRGEPVKGATVYFESNPSRGRVTGQGESNDPGWWGWQYAITGADGTAKATFTLDPSRGTGAGHTSVQIGTEGRGGADARTRADITIIGVMLTAMPAKTEIAPRDRTDITVALFEVGEDQVRRPLEGRSLYVETFRISGDARVVIPGPTDADGNPVTDANGEALLTFIAGEKEGVERIRILFQDVGTGYGDAIEAWADIVVKKDEYAGTIDWKETGSLIYEYAFQDQYDQHDYQYTLGIDATIRKEKNTGQEVTDASFTYSDTLSLYSEGRTVYESSPFGGSGTVPYEERWVINSQVNGRISDHQSINTVLKERLSTLEIPVTPFPVAFDVSGSCRYAGSILYKTGGSGQTAEVTGDVALTRSLQIPGRTPESGVVTDTLPRVSYDSPEYGTVQFLRSRTAAVDEKMAALSDPEINGLLVQTGKNVYERRWSVQDRAAYHGALFTFYEYEARMDMEASFTRDVTLKAVKQ